MKLSYADFLQRTQFSKQELL
ncbi:hypothetical protein MNBD_GAMMA02-581, partial [hydrothermal vent metagenome]